MSKYCGQCALLNLDNKRKYMDEYYCIEKKEYHSMTDRKADRCNSFLYDPSRSSSGKTSFKPSGLFYIVTAVNEILGLGNDDEMLKVLYEAGENLSNSESPIKEVIFEDYDLAGKEIANIIRKSENCKDIAFIIYNYYLMPIVSKLKKGEEIPALMDYLKMVDEMKQTYGINGMVELDYIYESALLFKDDILCATVNDVLHLDDPSCLITLSNFMATVEDQPLIDLYESVSIEFTDITYSIENDDKRHEFVNKYKNTFIKEMVYNIMYFGYDRSCIEELKVYLRNFLFYLNSENATKLFKTETNEEFQRILRSGR